MNLFAKTPSNRPALLNPAKLSPPTWEVFIPRINPPPKFWAWTLKIRNREQKNIEVFL